jgi:DUF1365 family protein
MTDEPSLIFPPPVEPALFFVGPVMHARFKPVPHRFQYEVFSLLVDLDRLDEADRLSRFFSVGRFNLISFDLKPHGPNPGDDPRQAARRMLKDAGLDAPVEKLFLLCYPKVLGFVFNPLSVYFADGSDNRLLGMIYEVRNTFGERHSYVAPIQAGELNAAGLRQSASKLFYVSPFLDQAMRYLFRVLPPGGERLSVRILERDSDGPILAATFTGQPERVADLSCLRLTFRMPFMTLKVMAGIHFEALRLWLKGVRFYPRPQRPPSVSHDGHFINAKTFVTKPDKAGPGETEHAA